jgi:lysozyme
VSLVYNAGPDPLRGHLGADIKAGEYEQAADEFLKWNHVHGVVVDGLTRRREAERELFLTSSSGAV